MVVKDVLTEVDHEATVLPSCSGSLVPMSFTGVNTLHLGSLRVDFTRGATECGR